MFITGGLRSGADGSGVSRSLPPATAHSDFSCGSSKRLCARQECSRTLPNVSHEPYTVCITCRGSCNVSSRCEECAGWDVTVHGGFSQGWSGAVARREMWCEDGYLREE
ncbi:hypothetical protein E2C01_102243 [Portunus trituberculatus]|uniref:Uncharacterized protein n=1 Tax=Portunus trituberculatus TaxID=210409 RepID=A0A5B7KMB2_PORTR|nr:hypothetical protein [Portunus trituberculatus]